MTIIECKNKLQDLHIVNQKLYRQYIKSNNEEESDFDKLPNISTQTIDGRELVLKYLIPFIFTFKAVS